MDNIQNHKWIKVLFLLYFWIISNRMFICWWEISKIEIMNTENKGDNYWSTVAKDAKEGRVCVDVKSLSLKKEMDIFLSSENKRKGVIWA